MLKTLILSIIWLMIVPCFIGLNIIKIAKKDNVFLAYIVGILIEFLVFEILAVPFTFLKFSFNSLKWAWTIIIILLTIISIIKNKMNFRKIINNNLDDVKKNPKILNIIFLILVLFQAYMGFTYMYEDYDDSNFVAKATIAKDTNTLFVYNDIGEKYDVFPTRHVFSPFPYWTATISELTYSHPAIIAHTIFPVIFIGLGYSLYYLIGIALFKNNKEKVFTFLIILCILYIFGKYSRYAIFVRLLGRSWQGKSLLANIILPFILYIFLEYIGDSEEKFGWFLFFITLWAGDLLSSMSLFLPLISSGILVVLFAIKDKNIKYIFKFIPCCIPNLVYGIMYFIIK